MRKFLVVIGIVIVIVGLGGLAFALLRSDPPISKALQKQITFVIYQPGAPWQLNKSETQYISSPGVLTLHPKKGATMLTITEQAAPSQFTDIPQFFPTLLNKLNSYESFGSVNGTVYLTKPTELKGGVEAVLANNGTLLFAHTTQSLSDGDWRQLFNNMQQLK